MNKLKLSLYTPESKVADKIFISEVLVPSQKGQLGILPGHAPLISLLDAGILEYWKEGSSQSHKVAVGWGYLEVSKNEVRVLAETAQTKKVLDKKKIERELKSAYDELQKSDFNFEKRQELEKKIKTLEAEKSLLLDRI